MNQDMFDGEIHDDTHIDLTKVMNRFQLDREAEEVYQKQLTTKFKDYDNLRTLLNNTGLIAEAITENGRPFNPSKNTFFMPASKVTYATIEWKDIEHTSLGRRLTGYFDQLKAERRLLASQIRAM